MELEEGAALAAAHRLLDRFTQQLVTESLAVREGEDGDGGDGDGGDGGADADAGTDADTAVGSAADADDAVAAEGLEGDEADADADAVGEDDADSGAGGDDDPGSVFDSPVPPPSLDPVAGVEFTVPDEPPAEAAHARRTMIGRSAEEVDHAPPRAAGTPRCPPRRRAVRAPPCAGSPRRRRPRARLRRGAGRAFRGAAGS